MKQYDVVALIVDRPDIGLVRGQVGTLLDEYDGGEAWEVEFCDNEGATIECTAIPAEQLMLLRYTRAQG